MSECISFNIENGRFMCIATTNETCDGVECTFHRTAKAQRASLGQAHARLRSLPEEAQVSIADTYYDGKMPWREDK